MNLIWRGSDGSGFLSGDMIYLEMTFGQQRLCI